jgi:hypothetical protein
VTLRRHNAQCAMGFKPQFLSGLTKQDDRVTCRLTIRLEVNMAVLDGYIAKSLMAQYNSAIATQSDLSR